MSTQAVLPPVLVPREPSHDRIGTALKQHGFGVIHAAVTQIVTLPDAGKLHEEATWQADWLVVTSANTVRMLPPDCLAQAREGGMRVAAVGRATARALTGLDIKADLVPSTQSGAGLVDAWSEEGARVLLPASQLAASTVPEGLAAKGCHVNRVDVYTSKPLEELPEVVAQAWQALAAVVVTSSSVARALTHLTEQAGLTWTRQQPIAIGGPTAATLAELGHPAAAVAAAPTPEGILTATLGVIHD